MTTRALIDVDLPSGVRARAFVSEDVIGVLVNGRTTIAHRNHMDAAQLAALSQCANELNDPTRPGPNTHTDDGSGV